MRIVVPLGGSRKSYHSSFRVQTDGRHFVEMNSSTVYFPAQRMIEKVVGARDFVTKSGSVRLDGDEQVAFVLQMASEELA